MRSLLARPLDGQLALDLWASSKPTCTCLRGDNGAAEGHPGPCFWLCVACGDTRTCGECIADWLTEDRPRSWDLSLSRWVVTVPTLYGLLDGAPGWTAVWTTDWRGRPEAISAPASTTPLPPAHAVGRSAALAELDQLTSHLRDGVDQLVDQLAEVEATTSYGRKVMNRG